AGFGTAAGPWLRAWQIAPRAPRDGGGDAGRRAAAHERHVEQPAADEPPRPAAPAAPPDERLELLAQLARRLGHIEDRLAALGAGARQRSARPRDTARRRRP